MSALHLVKLALSADALAVWAERRGLAGRLYDEGLALHHLLGETFGAGMLQPFRLMVAPRKRHGNLYAYSEQGGVAVRETAAAAAMPELEDVLGLKDLEAREMPELSAGKRVGFDLRARPIVRLMRDMAPPADRAGRPGRKGGFGKGSEVDAYLAEALAEHPDDRNGLKRDERDRAAVYLDWLAARLDGAAELDFAATRLARFRRDRALRGGRVTEGPDAVFQGTLTIRDRAAFAERLARGVGRHRAYGYGMLLLRPPDRRPPEC